MDWGARKSLSEQMESPASVSSSVVFENSRAEGTTTVDEVSSPGDSAGNGIAERAILTVGGLVRTTNAVVEENVLEGHDAGRPLTAWMAHHAAQVICACMVGADGLTPFRRLKGRKFGTPLAGFGVLERANKFTEARLLGSCLKSSRYIVVDFDGRFRMVRTIKRANADDRWKVVSPRDPFSAADLESTVQGGLEGKSIPLHNVWRDIGSMLCRRIQILILFRGGCTLSRVTYGMSDRCPGCRASVIGGRAQGHTEECRIRVEGEIKRTEEGKARLRAAASRAGEAPTGRALKRDRFAADRVGDDAEGPEDTSASAPSSLPAEAASTNSLPAHSSEAVLPASAVEVPDQLTSEGERGTLE